MKNIMKDKFASPDLPPDLAERLAKEFPCLSVGCKAKCCTNILIVSDKEIAKIRGYISKNNIQPCNRHTALTPEYIDKCPFLDDTSLQCTIYPVRPEICRNYFCSPYLKEAGLKTDYRNKRVVNMLLTFDKDAFCPNPPDLQALTEEFEAKKKKAYNKNNILGLPKRKKK